MSCAVWRPFRLLHLLLVVIIITSTAATTAAAANVSIIVIICRRAAVLAAVRPSPVISVPAIAAATPGRPV